MLCRGAGAACGCCLACDPGLLFFLHPPPACLVRAGSQVDTPSLKLTRWACGKKTSTLERGRAGCHRASHKRLDSALALSPAGCGQFQPLTDLL